MEIHFAVFDMLQTLPLYLDLGNVIVFLHCCVSLTDPCYGSVFVFGSWHTI